MRGIGRIAEGEIVAKKKDISANQGVQLACVNGGEAKVEVATALLHGRLLFNFTSTCSGTVLPRQRRATGQQRAEIALFYLARWDVLS
jgi:hypothetical protein